MLYHYLSALAHVLIIIWIILSMQRPFIHPYAYSIIILLFTIVSATVFILLLLLSFCYCYYYKTVATDKLLRASLFPGASELTTHLLRLIKILWLPLCRINKFGFYFPRRLLRSPYTCGSLRLFSGAIAGEHSFICKVTWNWYCSLQSIHHG
jgi:hypothetical protein